MRDDVGSVFILFRQTGFYSEVREVPILAFRDQQSAEAAREQATAQWSEAIEQYRDFECPEWRPIPDDAPEWVEWERKRNAENARFATFLTIDKNAAPEGWSSPEDPTYFVLVVPISPRLTQSVEDRNDR